MDEKIKELIAIGASVTANCVPCLKYHEHKARAAGATDEEITTAVNLGRTVRTGAARVWDEEANELLGVNQPAEAAEQQ